MAENKDNKVQQDKFTWSKGDIKFIPPEQNKNEQDKNK